MTRKQLDSELKGDLEELDELRLQLLSNDGTVGSADQQIAQRFAQDLVVKYPESARIWRAVGVVAYDLFMDGKVRAEDVEKPLLRSLELDPQEQFALLILGFVYYDSENYSEALDVLQRLDQDYFLDSPYWKWRGWKARELILSSRIRLGHLNVTLREVEGLFEEMNHVDSEDIPDVDQLADALEVTASSPIWRVGDVSRIRELVAQHQRRYLGLPTK